jgi:hypothetical protein
MLSADGIGPSVAKSGGAYDIGVAPFADTAADRYRREPITTKSASRAPQLEHTSRAAQSITVIVTP